MNKVLVEGKLLTMSYHAVNTENINHWVNFSHVWYSRVKSFCMQGSVDLLGVYLGIYSSKFLYNY